MKFTAALLDALASAENAGNIKEHRHKLMPAISEEEHERAESIGLSPQIVQSYRASNGLSVSWWADEDEGIGGAMNINPIRFLFRDEPSLASECDMDPEMDQELRHFRILENPTMNSQVGFFALPNEKPSQSMQFRMAGEQWTDDLDLDLDGYLEVASAARVFFNWQSVLVAIKAGEETAQTRVFKEHMPKLFAGFEWDAFVNKYQSLRLSKK